MIQIRQKSKILERLREKQELKSFKFKLVCEYSAAGPADSNIVKGEIQKLVSEWMDEVPNSVQELDFEISAPNLCSQEGESCSRVLPIMLENMNQLRKFRFVLPQIPLCDGQLQYTKQIMNKITDLEIQTANFPQRLLSRMALNKV